MSGSAPPSHPLPSHAAAVGAGVRVVNFKGILGGRDERCKLLLLVLLLLLQFDHALKILQAAAAACPAPTAAAAAQVKITKRIKPQLSKPPQNDTVIAASDGDCLSCR